MRSNITTRSILRFGAVAILAGSLALSGASMASAAPSGAPAAGEAPVAGATAASGKLKLKVTSRPAKNTEVGKPLVFKGTAPSKLKRKTVMLQLKVGTKWQTVAKSRITSKRTFKVQARATKAGAQRYRVAVASTRRTPAAASSSYRYTVWKWYNVLDLPKVDKSYYLGGYPDSGRIAGKQYPDSLFNYSTGWTEFNINYVCTRLRSVVGLDDASSAGVTREFYLVADSVTTSFGQFGVGSAHPVSADVSGVYRIRLGWGAKSVSNKDAAGVFGTPQVYCSSAP